MKTFALLIYSQFSFLVLHLSVFPILYLYKLAITHICQTPSRLAGIYFNCFIQSLLGPFFDVLSEKMTQRGSFNFQHYRGIYYCTGQQHFNTSFKLTEVLFGINNCSSLEVLLWLRLMGVLLLNAYKSILLLRSSDSSSKIQYRSKKGSAALRSGSRCALFQNERCSSSFKSS